MSYPDRPGSGYEAGMRTHRLAALILALSCALGQAACSTPKPEPEIISSAPQSGYAARYPEELAAATTRFNQQEEAAQKIAGETSGYPGALKDPKWDVTLRVVEQADTAGRSQDYVERLRRIEGAAGFFRNSKEEITKKVAGTAQYVAKQKGCEVDVSGAVARALEDTIEKELERHLRERNEAHRTIERHRAELGKENAAALEEQADDIALASYMVHVAMVEEKLRVRRLLEELETVQASIDEAMQAEGDFQSAPGRKDEEKKASEERSEALGKSKAMLESTTEQARTASEGLEERITAAQKRHKEAMDKLEADIRQRGNLPAPEPQEE